MALSRTEKGFIAALLLCCITWTLSAGKDLIWDLWNYHLYGPLSLVQGRLHQDFMAASIQSYLNPLPHLPLYAMVAADWHSLVIALVLTLMHAMALVLLFFVSRTEGMGLARHGVALPMTATALGAATVIYWNGVGTSFADMPTALPALAGIWLYATRRLERRPLVEAFVLGSLFGLAAGLKVTNAIYLVAAGVFPLWQVASAASRARALAMFGLGGALSIAASGGYWMWLLWREFGNPVFPLYNAIFRSPDFPPVSFYHARFLPQSIGEALLAPLRMVLPEPRLYSEVIAPDLRVVLLIALAIALVVKRMATRRAPPVPNGPSLGSAVPALGAFYAIALIGWIATSFNARYTVPLLLLTGPLLVCLGSALLPPRRILVVSLSILALQVTAIVLAGTERWSPFAWTKRWIEIRVPERLRSEPFLYLTIDTQPRAALAMFLHPDSGMVNVRGQHALDLDGPGGARLAALLAANPDRVRTLSNSLLDIETGLPEAQWLEVVNTIYGRFGLRMARTGCLRLEQFDDQDRFTRLANRLLGWVSPIDEFGKLMSCALERVPVDPVFLRERPRIDRVFDAVERACPRLFTPGLARTERIGDGWARAYSTTDRALILDRAQHLYTVIPNQLGRKLSLGNAADWEQGAAPYTCKR